MKKLTVLAASMALAAVSVIPAFAQVPTGATTPKTTAGQVKTMPAKAKPSIHATTKKPPVKRTVKQAVKRPAVKTPTKTATSSVR